MATLVLPDVQESPVELESAQRVTKGPKTEKERLQGRLALGTLCTRITTEHVKDDKDLSTFMTTYTESADFYLVQVKCTFVPAPEEPFQQAWLYVKLDRDGGQEGPKPEVWSMDPQRSVNPVKVTNSTSIGASLKFQDIGLEAGGSSEVGFERQLVFLRAYEEGSNPFWEFRETELAKINGTVPLKMIVRVPKGLEGRVAVTLQATIRRKILGVINYTTDFPGASEKWLRLSEQGCS